MLQEVQDIYWVQVKVQGWSDNCLWTNLGWYRIAMDVK
jgi:hypothetical protein